MMTLVRSFARCFLVAAAALSVGAIADDAKPQPLRTVLERHDQSGVPGKEVVMGTATLPPGTAIGFHEHAGDESGYVVKGSVTWKVKGQPDKTVKTGESFFNPRGSVHSIAAAGDGEAMVMSTWIVDKGKPLATMVP
jgi:quercetin dioxygenase-like cupin family protein